MWLPLFKVQSIFLHPQGAIDDDMLAGIIANHKEGGVVKELASFYTQCLAAGTLSSKFWNMIMPNTVNLNILNQTRHDCHSSQGSPKHADDSEKTA